MGEIESNSILRNLTDELTKARTALRSYALKIPDHTTKNREQILEQLAVMKESTQSQTRVFTNTIRSVVDNIDHTWSIAEPVLYDLTQAGFVLWILGLSASSLALFGTFLFMTSLSCDWCHWQNKARIMLVISVSVVAISSVILAIFIIFQLVVGGHSEFFICRPLYEGPNYSILSRLLDKPGLIYSSDQPTGVLGDLIKGDLNSQPTVAINVSFSETVSQCEVGSAAYEVFNLEALLNLTTVLDFRNHPQVLYEIDEVSAPDGPFIGLTTVLQGYLEEMVTDSALNLTSHRLDLVQLTPEKDLITFIDQMQRVSVQV